MSSYNIYFFLFCNEISHHQFEFHTSINQFVGEQERKKERKTELQLLGKL
jgi:hypothetical protein